MSLSAQAIALDRVGSARLLAKSVAPILQFMVFDQLAKKNTSYKRIHGIIGGIPLYGFRRYHSTDAARPLFFRPSGEVFMSAREGGSTNTVRIEMFVTGKYALTYIATLKILKRFGNGALFSRITLNAQGIPLPVIQQLGQQFETRTSPLSRLGPFKEFTYPFITRDDLFGNAKIENLHIERDVEDGINFSRTVKLDIVKVSDPFVIGKSDSTANLIQGTAGVSTDAITSFIWASLNSSGPLRGGEVKLSRFRTFGPFEGNFIRLTDPESWEKVTVRPYTQASNEDRQSGVLAEPQSNIYKYESTEPSDVSPRSSVTPQVLEDLNKVSVEDPSRKNSGEFAEVYNNIIESGTGLPVGDFPLRIPIVFGEANYNLDIMFYTRAPTPFESTQPSLVGTRMTASLFTTDAETGNVKLLKTVVFNAGTIYAVRDSARALKILFEMPEFSWSIDDSTKDVTTIPVKLRVRCAIQ